MGCRPSALAWTTTSRHRRVVVDSARRDWQACADQRVAHELLHAEPDDRASWLAEGGGKSILVAATIVHLLASVGCSSGGHVFVNSHDASISLIHISRLPMTHACPVLGPQGVMLRTFVAKLATNGCRARWGLATMYNACMPETAAMTASRWYSSWWPWWERRLAKLGAEAQLTRPPPTASTPTAADVSSRVWPEASAGTLAMLLLLVRWAAPSKTQKEKKNENFRRAWESVPTST